ncbi:DUF1501 domain-containing protein [Leptospira ognonensis]|uniref:DUF1501 domain-containing protein n=1 Tax=Leptospira ognonensis TaxID=2484945 RepID=UPI001AEF7CE1|nr:DUF1501 domain-containing protein [Leptospira ognonensis]
MSTNIRSIERKLFLKRSLALLSAAFITSGVSSLSGAEENEEEAEFTHKSPVKSIIFINMEGGMSHVDTLDPKSNSSFSKVSSSINGISLLEPFSKTAGQLKHLGIIRSTWSEDGDHAFGQYLLNTGYRMPEGMGFPDIPHFGSIFAFAKKRKTKESYFPSYVTMGGRNGRIGNSGFLGVPYSGFHIGNLDNAILHLSPALGKYKGERLMRRQDILSIMNEEFRAHNKSSQLKTWSEMVNAAEEFRNSADLASFDITKEPEAMRARYGNSWQGKACLMAKRLAEKEVPFIQITIGGWDTHNNNKAQIAKIMNDSDQGISALIEDLAASGLLNQTVFFLSSEFGRTPDVGSRDGRDHHPRVWTSLLGGGPFQKGFVLGESDEKGERPAKNTTAYHVRDIIASIHHASGVDTEASLTNSFGRPFPISPRSSKIIEDIMNLPD